MISVCMATYNGERYIERQLDSILVQLGDDDEVIVSDDGSTDRTPELLARYGADRRIRIIHGGFHSPIYNFEHAIRQAKGDYIFMADQDDVWLPGRVSEALGMHRQGIDLVICKAENIDGEGKVFRAAVFDDPNPVRHSLLWNLYKNPYLGCCMSFDRKLTDAIVPFPASIAMHDIWIGLVAQRLFTCDYYAERPLVQYRRHGINFTEKHKYRFWGKIRYRLKMLSEVLRRTQQYKRTDKRN